MSEARTAATRVITTVELQNERTTQIPKKRMGPLGFEPRTKRL